MITAMLISMVTISLFLGLVEWATIHYRIPKKHSRKIIHVGTSLLVILLSSLFDWHIFIYLGIIFFFVLWSLRVHHPLKSLSDRADESFGEILFPIGVAFAAYLSQTETNFIITMLVLGISDTLAYYIGSALKSKKIINNKTIYGSLGFLISTFIFCLFITPPATALFIALIITFAELSSTKGFDNLSVPAICALLLTYAA